MTYKDIKNWFRTTRQTAEDHIAYAEKLEALAESEKNPTKKQSYLDEAKQIRAFVASQPCWN